MHPRRRISAVLLCVVSMLGCEEERASEAKVVEESRLAVHSVLQKIHAIELQVLDDQALRSLAEGSSPVCNFGMGVNGNTAAIHGGNLHELSAFRRDEAGIGNNRALRTASVAISDRKFLDGGHPRALQTESPGRGDDHVQVFKQTLDDVAGLNYLLILHTKTFRAPPSQPPEDGAEFTAGRIEMEVRVWSFVADGYIGGFSAWAENSPAASGIRGERFEQMLHRDLETNARTALQTACIGWGGQAPQ